MYARTEPISALRNEISYIRELNTDYNQSFALGSSLDRQIGI